MITIPLLSLSGSWNQSTVSSYLSSTTIKSVTLSAYSGAFAAVSVPKIIGSGTASYDTVSAGYVYVPRLTLSASGYQQPYGSLSASIPAVNISAAGQCMPLASLSKSLQPITLTATGLAGESISLSKAIGAVKLRSEAYWSGVNSLAASIPAITIRSHIVGEMIALSMNLRNNSLAQYDNYNFNSVCKFKGVYLGCKTDGIRVLAGETDEEQEISWSVDLGDLDLSGAKLRYVWLTGAISNAVTLVVEETAGDKNTYEYIQEPYIADESEMRIKVGKNIRSKQSRYVNPVINGYGAAKIDRIHIFGETGKQR